MLKGNEHNVKASVGGIDRQSHDSFFLPRSLSLTIGGKIHPKPFPSISIVILENSRVFAWKKKKE